MKKSHAIILYLVIAAAGLAYYLRPIDGLEIFKRERCTLCHFIGTPEPGKIDLTRVIERRSETWIRDQIIYPKSHNPASGMPSFGHLSNREINAIIMMFREAAGK